MHRLIPLASRHVFPTAAAIRVGHDSHSLRALARQGRIRRLARGWWALHDPAEQHPPWHAPDPYRAERRLHRLRCIAYLRHYGGRAVPSHYSALVLHEVATYRSDLGTVHLCRSSTQGSRRGGDGVALHRTAGQPHTFTADGLATATLPLAVVQTGLLAYPEASAVAADDALRQGLVTVGQLQDSLEHCRHSPGVAAVRRLLAHADGRHESPGETLTALALRGLGLGFVPQQVVVTAGGTYRVDFLLEDHPVIVEFDGVLKYQGTPDLVAEKRREDELRALGYQVVRLVWSDLHRTGRVRALLQAAITRC